MGHRHSLGLPCLQGPTKPGRMVLAGPIEVKCGLICPHTSICLFKIVVDVHFDVIFWKSLIKMNDY